MILATLCLVLLYGGQVRAAGAGAGNAALQVSGNTLKKINMTFIAADGSTYTMKEAMALSIMVQGPDGKPVKDPATGLYTIDPNREIAFLNGFNSLFPQTLAAGNGFMTTSGRIIDASGTSQSGIARINLTAEQDFLTNVLLTGAKGEHAVTYTAPSTVGSTYVEVDIQNQHLYYYRDGVLQFDTPIVTGNTSRHHDTPNGVFHILGKSRSITLVGKGYTSFVNYWVPFIGHSYGIHDATWRSSFGGEIYKTNGSHGCVNVPLAAMEQLYPMLEVGTPVVIFN